jgi:predicted transcriptional regulator
MDFEERDLVKFHLTFKEEIEIDIKGRTSDLGFRRIVRPNEWADPDIESYYKDNTYLAFRKAQNGSVGEMKIEILSDTGVVEDPTSSIISQMGIPPDKISEKVTTNESVNFSVVRPVSNIDPEKIDWGQAMKSEIEWLMDQDVLTGISEEDIVEIMDSCRPDRMGVNGRIGYFKPYHYQPNGQGWIPYFMSDGPFLFETFDHVNLHDLEDFPVIPEESEDPFNMRIIFILIAAVMILLIIFSVYGRIKTELLLQNEIRRRIFNEIRKEPGIHFREIIRRLELNIGTLSHHLNILEKKRYIRSIQDGNYRRFYLYNEKVEFKIYLTSLQIMIMNLVNREPGISQSNISREVGKNRVVINYNVHLLKDIGFLHMEKNGRESSLFLTYNGIDFLES